MNAVLSMFALVALATGAAPADPPSEQADDSAVRSSTASFESGGKPIEIERVEPKTDGAHPAVLIVHGADGMKAELTRAFYRRVLRQAADRGYVAFLVHYYDRVEGKAGDREGHLTKFVPWLETLDDAITYVGKQPGVDPKRIGLIGFSLGSYLSLSRAANDDRVGAVVEYFGGMSRPAQRRLERMPPVLILHGERDRTVSIDKARELEATLKEKSLPYEIKIYPEQGHGFRGEDARDALERAFAFLDKHLKPKAD